MKRLLFLLLLASSLRAQSITLQPVSQTVVAGQTATFTATVSLGPCNPMVYFNGGGHYLAKGSTVSFTTPVATLAMNGWTVQFEFWSCAGGPLDVRTGFATLTVLPAPVVIALNITPASTAVFDDGSPLLPSGAVNIQQQSGTTAVIAGVISSDATGNLAGTITVDPSQADANGYVTFTFGLPMFPDLKSYSVPVSQFKHAATGLTLNLVLYKSNFDIKSQTIAFTP
jgi:hypothetical protein